MMEVSEVVDRLKELGGKPSLSSSDKQEIEALYGEVLDKKFVRTSCNDCYRDAVIEMSVYLRKNGKMKEKSNYRLKNGVLLQMGFGSSEFYTNANLTDEISETYLAKYPNNSNYFSKIPDDWKERVSKSFSVQYNQNLLDDIIQSIKDGVSKESIQESFNDYLVNGKKVTKKSLNAHIKEAQRIISEE